MQRVKVWDLPVRLFHWALVLLIGAAWLTQYLDGLMEWHRRIGCSILALLLFRVVWGFVGSDSARFSRFLQWPWVGLRHLIGLWRREPDREVGHNAAGGWMVLVMLALVAVQGVTGLFANDLSDGGDTEGPLMHYVSQDRSDWLSHIHAVNFTLIEAVIVLHLVALVAYAVLKRHDLVRPMVTGWKRMPDDVAAPRMVSGWRALLVLAVAVGVMLFVWSR